MTCSRIPKTTGPNQKPIRSPSNYSMRIQTPSTKKCSGIPSKVETSARMANYHRCSNFSSRTPPNIHIINPLKMQRFSQRRRNPRGRLCCSSKGRFWINEKTMSSAGSIRSSSTPSSFRRKERRRSAYRMRRSSACCLPRMNCYPRADR
jgi:hypothetical protein